MRQLLKHYARRLLPGSLLGHLKDRSERRFVTAAPRHACTLEEGADTIRCRFDDGRSFLGARDCHGELHYFTDSPRGRTEFSALVEAATGARVAFDIGAHAGMISALFCAANPRLQVHAFEPSPLLCRRLENTVALNGFADRLSIQPVGIGAEAGTVEMLIDPAGGFVQTQRFDHTMWAQPEAIQVRLETVAQAAGRLGVVPDLVKLDIEGFEYEAIQGSRDFLRQHRPTILLELHLNYLAERRRSARALVGTLTDAGYKATTYSGRPLRPAQVYASPLSTVHLLLRAA